MRLDSYLFYNNLRVIVKNVENFMTDVIRQLALILVIKTCYITRPSKVLKISVVVVVVVI